MPDPVEPEKYFNTDASKGTHGMEDLNPAVSGHPYLPGTASLVQEIDSRSCKL